MPLTPEANLDGVSCRCSLVTKRNFHILDKLLSLDVGHTVNTGDTITVLIVRKKLPKVKKSSSVRKKHVF